MQASNVTPNAVQEIRRHWQFSLRETPRGAPAGTPIKGGMKTDGTAAQRLDDALTGRPHMAGARALFMLTRKESTGLDTPVFSGDASEPGSEAILVFTSREQATLYLQVARWDNYQVRDFNPSDFSLLVRQARQDGLLLLVDPNRQQQMTTAHGQAYFDPKDRGDLDGEALYAEMLALGKTGLAK
jgi:hypothetical protein